ncbi:nuclear egress membrane protein [Macropodid alphaherpesvirus 4]|uniref:Nuclear egress membrane protein n=1 Tax=Macropodid alphaherpesvirus 4 TaxID=2762721 RepID=A0A7L7YSF9_9ALPH|nr:nuclear egress membrane protein [Macropodid alphaherpesvirus 4]QOD40168.1 nuclear egress membrane protein [Macropodid alphaherpesvirus 4]
MDQRHHSTISSYHRANALLYEKTFDCLKVRIHSILPPSMLTSEFTGRCNSSKLPSHSIFKVYSFHGDGDTFPVEYVLELMRTWAAVECDPYIRIQNTGVSILFEGFFNMPYDSPTVPVTRGTMNVSLAASETTGLSLQDIHSLKCHAGVDPRPLMAQLGATYFVRARNVQIAFRFLGPEDKDRVKQIVKQANNTLLRDRNAPRRHQGSPASEDELGETLREISDNQPQSSIPSKLMGCFQTIKSKFEMLFPPTWAVPVGGLLIGGIFWGAVAYGHVPIIKPPPST